MTSSADNLEPQPKRSTRPVFRLYVTGQTSRSLRAIDNVRRLCQGAWPEAYELAVVDVLERPELAEENRILATPTLVREAPQPSLRVIGDLSDVRRVMQILGIEPRSEDPGSGTAESAATSVEEARRGSE